MNRQLGAFGRRLSILALACSVIGGAQATSGTPVRDEREVRAAYVFNLVKYVDWPSNRGEILIGFVGETEFGAVMEKMLSGRSSDSYTIRVLVMPTEEELARCKVVYFAAESQEGKRKILNQVKDMNVLTIGESEAFVRGGGVIALVKAGDRIQIQVNPDAAQRARVQISSRVLNLATIVHSTQGTGN